MSKKFITQREIDFINNITKELTQNVVQEEILYYAISVEKTRVNRLYNEAVKKTWLPPAKANALVYYDNSTTVAGNGTLDSRYSLEVYFHKKELEERNIVPREGDFVEYGQIFYEITSVTVPQVVFGQVNNKVMFKCTCVPSREGQFQAGNRSALDIDHSHQIENSAGTPPTNTLGTDATYASNPLATSTYQFPPIYYGVSTIPGSYNQTFVTSFGINLRVNSISQIGTLSAVTAASNQYIYICLPSSFGASAGSFIDTETEFEAAMSLATQVTVNDSSDGPILYDVWRSNRPGLGTVTIRIS